MKRLPALVAATAALLAADVGSAWALGVTHAVGLDGSGVVFANGGAGPVT